MNITDELREYAEEQIKWLNMPKVHYRKLLEIANRIDAEHESKVGCTADEWDYWESTHVELPKDADGEHVHIDDVMEWPTTGETFEVVGIGDGTLFYIDDGSEKADWTGASTKRHYKPPTVEDVLRDMHMKLDEVTALYVGEAIDSDERDRDEARIFAEYAAKLQLASNEE